jgi:hypothetical protein
MSMSEPAAPALDFTPEMLTGWQAALAELQHQAEHLESRGALRAAVTLFDAVRIARAGGLNCEHGSRQLQRAVQN